MKKLFLITLSLFLSNVTLANTSICNELLGNLENGSALPTIESTESFIGYLKILMDNQILKKEELSTFVSQLEKGILSNPIPEEAASIDSRLFIHRQGLQEYIEFSQIDQKTLLDWIKQTTKERQQIDVKKEVIKAKTKDVFQPMDFNQVEPGRFRMGAGKKKLSVTLTNPFQMISTPITQRQWALVMGNNPAEYKFGENTIVLSIKGKQIKMQPDNPVEKVSWNDTQIFIRKLNSLSRKNDRLLYSLIPDYKKGDRFRLPTEAEWEFVVRNRGKFNSQYPFENGRSSLKKYAWFEQDYDSGTHPVGQKAPIMVDGKEFYDLLGNVWEWVQDGSGEKRICRGGSFYCGTTAMTASHRWSNDIKLRDKQNGFRLVRVRE